MYVKQKVSVCNTLLHELSCLTPLQTYSWMAYYNAAVAHHLQFTLYVFSVWKGKKCANFCVCQSSMHFVVLCSLTSKSETTSWVCSGSLFSITPLLGCCYCSNMWHVALISCRQNLSEKTMYLCYVMKVMTLSLMLRPTHKCEANVMFSLVPSLLFRTRE